MVTGRCPVHRQLVFKVVGGVKTSVMGAVRTCGTVDQSEADKGGHEENAEDMGHVDTCAGLFPEPLCIGPRYKVKYI